LQRTCGILKEDVMGSALVQVEGQITKRKRLEPQMDYGRVSFDLPRRPALLTV
jgi:hypothetical protein